MSVVLVSLAFLSVLMAIGISLDRGRRRGPLREAMRVLDGARAGGAQVAGRRRGFDMTFRLTTMPYGDHSEEYTEIRARVPELPLMLDLRPETHGTRLLVERGLAVDLKLGDEDFDRAFLIEAAPADVVERFLTAELRRDLLHLYPCTLKVSGGEIVWQKMGWLEHGIDIEQALDIVAYAMARVRSAFAEADEQALAEAPVTGAPFRGVPDQAAVVSARSAREGEVTALESLRRRRELAHRPELLYGLLAAVVILAFVALVVLL